MQDNTIARGYRNDETARADLAREITRDMHQHINHPQSPIADEDVLTFAEGVQFALRRLEFRLSE